MSCVTPSSGGYDSDVERDKRRDYTIKTYANPIRDGIGGTKPHLQEAKPASGEKKPTVSRNIATTPIVACSQTTVGVKASVCMHVCTGIVHIHGMLQGFKLSYVLLDLLCTHRDSSHP